MFGLDDLIKWDKELLSFLNGSDSLFVDGMMVVATSTQIWLPLAIVLMYVLLKNNSSKRFFLILLFLSLTILFCDQIASGFCKPFFARFRPSRDPFLMYSIDIVNGYRGARYGFMSSHAANTFGVSVFLSLLLKRRSFTLALFSWALLNSWSRIYLGVHYPGDVLFGALVGCMVGMVLYILYRKIDKRLTDYRSNWISGVYTSSGYLVSDVNLLTMFLLLTYVLIPCIGIFMVHVY